MDPDTALGSNSGWDVTMAMMIAQATISASSSPPKLPQSRLSPQHINHSASLSLLFLHHIFAHQNGVRKLKDSKHWAGLWVSSASPDFELPGWPQGYPF